MEGILACLRGPGFGFLSETGCLDCLFVFLSTSTVYTLNKVTTTSSVKGKGKSVPLPARGAQRVPGS